VNSRVLSLVERVLRRADRDHAADAVLRLELKSQHGLSRSDTADATRAVFSFFRWRGWLKPTESLRDQVVHAINLAQQFRANREAFSDTELVENSVPSWVHNEIEITPAFARFLQSEPPLWLRARPGQGRLLAQRLQDCIVLGDGELSDILEYRGEKDLFRTDEFRAGEFELQDISSQMVGLICAPLPGETWWDACAGEGGKLLHLSDLMQNKGLIWASDRAAWRLRRLKRRAARARAFNYRAALWDGGSKLPTKTKFDGILVDAPCSGTGTWQRNPHGRWTLLAMDIKELSELQLQLLVTSAAAIKPGGKLIYSVCSLARSETDELADRFEKRCTDFERVPLKNPLDANNAPSDRLLLGPPKVRGNGMFIAAWACKRSGTPC
jgi:16S rRNA (cytosine967-C5)-methyltransferase